MSNIKKYKDYQLTELAMAIIPERDEKGKYVSRVIEESREYFMPVRPTKMIDFACRSFGSSLQNQQLCAKNVSEITHKTPISISFTSEMYFFPTGSPQSKDCSWISHSHIFDLQSVNNGIQTAITFKNGKLITVDISLHSMRNQQFKTAQYRYLMNVREKVIRESKSEIHLHPYHVNKILY